MRQFVIKNNPKYNRESCERWYNDKDGDKLVGYMIKNGMCCKRYDIFIVNNGRWILISKEEIWKVCNKRNEKRFLASYRD